MQRICIDYNRNKLRSSIRLNRYAEELEPEAMAAAKREDRKLG